MRENTAYDYRTNAVPQRQDERHAVIRELPARQNNRRPRKNPYVKLVKRAAVAAVALAMVCFNIYSRAEISDVKAEISSVQTQLDKAYSRQTSLEMKMESIVSYTNLEEAARALGMQKRLKSQIHYVDTSGEDYAEVLN